MNKLLVEANQQKDMLFDNMKSIILSTVDLKQNPNASYAPSVIYEGNFYIYISKLSKHTSNLIDTSKASIMIIEDESKAEQLFGRKRVTMSVQSDLIHRDSEHWIKIIDKMESKFGDSMTFLKDLTDFHLFKFEPQSGLLVYGFGRAFRLNGTNLNEVDFLNDQGHTNK
tara:strand:+ start:316 stop:822 length:507 start_codon:yes stop_codon:yes gene_type:complete